MIEQGIYFALGCVVTALLALGFGPFYWRRALRLTRRRLQLQVPLSMEEIAAERDHLRAEFAVERLRLEQDMEGVRATKARDMVDIGRQRIAATALEEDAETLRRQAGARDREIERLTRALSVATDENSAMKVELHEGVMRLETARRDAEEAAALHESTLEEIESKRIAITDREKLVARLEAQLADLRHKAEGREQGLRGRLEMAVAQSARHETQGLSLRRELDEAKVRLRSLEQNLETIVGEVRERERGTDQRRGPQGERKHPEDRAQAEMVDRLRAENDALKEVVTANRREAFSVADDEEIDGGLRASIHALGLAVADMARSDQPGETIGRAEQPRHQRDAAPRPINAR